MSDNHSAMMTTAADDGWSDAAQETGERMIRGKILKFADWRWIAGKEGEVVPDGTTLIALAAVAMWVRWQGGKPVEHIVRQPGRRLPDREELSNTDESEWECSAGGEPIDPWANTRLIYLVHPATAEAFTFSTSSWGGRNAVSDLGDQITRMRSVHPDALPIVELRAAEMPTKFGKKSKPLFKIVGWRTADAEKPAPAERQITAQAAKHEVERREMDDEIPF